jgi:hypothetical protein
VTAQPSPGPIRERLQDRRLHELGRFRARRLSPSPGAAWGRRAVSRGWLAARRSGSQSQFVNVRFGAALPKSASRRHPNQWVECQEKRPNRLNNVVWDDGDDENAGSTAQPARGFRGTPPSAIVYAVPDFLCGMWARAAFFPSELALNREAPIFPNSAHLPGKRTCRTRS